MRRPPPPNPSSPVADVVGMVFIVAALIGAVVLCCLQGCATWQETTRRTLHGAHVTGRSAHDVAKNLCKPALEKCIADKTNPCPALLDCQRKRRPFLKALDSLQRGVLLGLLAVDAGDRPNATKWMVAALGAAEQIRAALKTWGVKW